MLKKYIYLFSLMLLTMPLYPIDDFQPQTYHVKAASDIEKLFPKTVDEINARFESIKNYMVAEVDKIIAIPAKERTYENTVLALDKAIVNFEIFDSILSIIKNTNPNDLMRAKAKEALLNCIEAQISLFSSNKKIYEACKEYKSNSKETLNEERTYYLDNLMKGFKRAGFDLEDEKFNKLKEFNKQIADLSMQFQSNISQDNSKVHFKIHELPGIEESFINSLPKIDEEYAFSCDYPTAFQLMTNCCIEATREKFFQAFRNRAFPKNIEILNQIINIRDELANLLGYKSYADFDLSSTMAETVNVVEDLLKNLFLEQKGTFKQCWKCLLNDLPESVTLTSEGKLKPWDYSYLSNYYLKKHLDVDQNKIAEYFQMEGTVQGLMDIYEQFFNYKFKVVQADGFWDPSVQLIEVSNKEVEQIIGYVLVDLFPRENKYTHACCYCVIPPMSYDNGKSFAPAVALVIANFSKSMPDKPSLLKHDEVKTFFHEFGHAIHALSGKSEMPTRSGYSVIHDFVETPSKLLEEWIWDKEILRNLSRHYKTGESLSDEALDNLIKSRQVKDALNLEGQLLYSELSLKLYLEGKNKDFVQIKKDVYLRNPDDPIAYDDNVGTLCSFVHLTAYGPKYYTYLWSEQLAKKIFDYIKTNGGLLDPVMGRRYISKIIGRGGSCHPNKMIDDFLNSESDTAC